MNRPLYEDELPYSVNNEFTATTNLSMKQQDLDVINALAQ